MTSGKIVQDPFLQSVLLASADARQRCMELIDFAERSAVSSSQTLPNDIKLHLSQQQRLLHSDLATLRDASRESIFEVRMTKQSTSEARQEIDRLHLQLQNFYYEERHLRGEISACESYDHQYQQLPLIPVEEFLLEQPEHSDDDEKSLMFARINHELAEREALEQQRQGLLKTKQSLIADNKKRKEDLASLDKDLETFIDAAKPIQKLFEKH
ncbi:MAG: hypothetical protein LQ343_005839 [Gyalolechia ehrenbergii]|nr:MAG: hypothetical protein LQ343_005839 [Gyalolechia ehrenbergii]